MANSAKRPAPVSVRFNEAERTLLVARAGNKPLSAYIKAVLFADGPVSGRIVASPVRGDREALARLLAWLGQTQLTAHLAIISNAAESGSLDMSEPVTSAILKACSDIDDMREALMLALGKLDIADEGRSPASNAYLNTAEAAE